MIGIPVARIVDLDQLPEGATRVFHFRRDGVRIQAFVACIHGQIVAYENLCRHIPLPLDYGDGRFFTPDRRHFVCSNHGALYDPISGLCVAGPCSGAKLKPVAVEVSEGAVWLVDTATVEGPG